MIMGIAGSVITFMIAWMLAFMAMLPLGGIRSQLEAGKVVAGSDPGAPVRPKLARKAMWATIIAFVVWAVLFVLANYVLTVEDLKIF